MVCLRSLPLVLVCLTALCYRTAADCYPREYFQNAPDTLDTSGCSGFLNDRKLTKVSHWTIIWPSDDDLLRPIYINAIGFGGCQAGRLACWPSFEPPHGWSQVGTESLAYENELHPVGSPRIVHVVRVRLKQAGKVYKLSTLQHVWQSMHNCFRPVLCRLPAV
jgi:hypothetical protein